MASAARKPYRKAPPQHREQRHATPVLPPEPASHLNLSQVTITPAPRPPLQSRRPPLPVWDSDPDASSLSSLDQNPNLTPSNQDTASGGPRRGLRLQSSAAPLPRGILKQPTPRGAGHPYDAVRKSKSVELLRGGGGRSHPSNAPPTSSSLSCTSDPPTSCLEERRRFSNFLDEITRRVLSPARLSLLGQTTPPLKGKPAPLRPRHVAAGRKPWVWEELGAAPSSERTRRWDRWVAAVRRPGSLHSDWRPQGAELLFGYVTEGAESMQQQVPLWAGRRGGRGKEPSTANHRAAAAVHESPQGPRKVGGPSHSGALLVAPHSPPLSPMAPPTVIPPTVSLQFSCPPLLSVSRPGLICEVKGQSAPL